MVRHHFPKRHKRSARVVLCGLALVAAGGALALTACSDAGQGEEVGQVSSELFANDKTAFDYFLGKGLTNYQATGIVGNLDQESGVDPNAVQSGGAGRGIAQWSVGGRWDTDSKDNATWYAGTKSLSVWSLPLQLDFIWYELSTFSGYGLAKLKATTNVTDATIVFQNDFEGCGTCDQTQRVAYAKAVLSAYGSDTADASSDVSTDIDCTVTATGETGLCMDTAECAALGNHISTPGYCPGAANIECCTATTPTVDAGTKDSGTVADSDTAKDSGNVADSGIAKDSGNVADSGTAKDSGSVTDSGSANDSSSVVDSGIGADSEIATDSGAAGNSNMIVQEDSNSSSGCSIPRKSGRGQTFQSPVATLFAALFVALTTRRLTLRRCRR
jgi:hypothetical protein